MRTFKVKDTWPRSPNLNRRGLCNNSKNQQANTPGERQGLVLCARHARALSSQERDCSPGAPIRRATESGVPLPADESYGPSLDANERHRLLTPRHCHGGKLCPGQTAIWGS